jgi:hypothetical protein
MCAPSQVEALLDKIGQQPPVMDYVAWQLERLGYAWSYRVVETAGERAGLAQPCCSCNCVHMMVVKRGHQASWVERSHPRSSTRHTAVIRRDYINIQMKP